MLGGSANAAAPGWTITTIETIELGGRPSIAVDSNDDLHVSYSYNWWNTAELRYATNKSGTWDITMLDDDENAGGYSSIAVDPNDKIHISYSRFKDSGSGGGQIRYITNRLGPWDMQKVVEGEEGPVEIMLENTSIAVDAVGRPHIVWRGKYATTPALGSGFTTMVFDTVHLHPTHPSIDLDASGRVHISHYDGGGLTEYLWYTTNVTGGWGAHIADDGDGDKVGRDSEIVVDSSGKVHIAYYDYSNGDLKYATNASGTWTTQTIEGYYAVGEDCDIAVDSNDRVHISYYDHSFSALKYATNRAGGWVITQVDNSGFVGYNSAIALDSMDNVHIVYKDITQDTLQYAFWENPHTPVEVSLLSPNGGELATNTPVNIPWSSSGYSTMTDVKLEYSTDNGSTWTTIIASWPNYGIYPWTTPATPEYSDGFMIRVSDALDGEPSDTNDTPIELYRQANITLYSPAAGDQWPAGTTQSIEWTSSWVRTKDAFSTVCIDLSLDGGTTWQELGSRSECSQGIRYGFDYRVPAGHRDNCRVRARNSDASVSVVSDVFTMGGSIVIAPILILLQ
ncbi:MAG: hypothetical protein D3926_10105 [Desulfobacteraceae bacterium]|nr:MAG: hypothetical protein D3926_10105 [Desulfobacteraceae bacterium]